MENARTARFKLNKNNIVIMLSSILIQVVRSPMRLENLERQEDKMKEPRKNKRTFFNYNIY
ncbi:MAG: hypothetical protein QXT80_00800 [Thermoplasmatales archaeon]